MGQLRKQVQELKEQASRTSPEGPSQVCGLASQPSWNSSFFGADSNLCVNETCSQLHAPSSPLEALPHDPGCHNSQPIYVLFQ